MFRTLMTILGVLLILLAIGAGGVLYVFQQYGRDLPDYKQLATYEPPVMTRVHAGDGRLLAEYAVEKRVFVPIKAMPKRVLQAFLSAEDKNFYYHPGIDIFGIIRAAVTNLKNLGRSRRLVGASTITQQVAKNFLLSSEVSWRRKVKEAILSFRMERAFSKDRILELYLNEIYLGFGSYGVAAAALNYFNKSLGELSIAELAFLAALPKAPNNYNPFKKPLAAKSRRDWVIRRMMEDEVITPEEAAQAKAMPLEIRKRSQTEFVTAAYFAEEVRKQLAARYGENQLYKGGLSVRTTLNPRLQALADKVLRDGLKAYDHRHGWRGPVTQIPMGAGWWNQLAAVTPPKGSEEWRLAAVVSVDPHRAYIGFADNTRAEIPLVELKWARAWMKKQLRGPAVRHPKQVLATGNVVLVERVTADAKGKPYAKATYGLRQMPEIEGGIVALDPHTGRILAMSGGYSFERNQFNRVTQAARQPGRRSAL